MFATLHVFPTNRVSGFVRARGDDDEGLSKAFPSHNAAYQDSVK